MKIPLKVNRKYLYFRGSIILTFYYYIVMIDKEEFLNNKDFYKSFEDVEDL